MDANVTHIYYLTIYNLLFMCWEVKEVKEVKGRHFLEDWSKVSASHNYCPLTSQASFASQLHLTSLTSHIFTLYLKLHLRSFLYGSAFFLRNLEHWLLVEAEHAGKEHGGELLHTAVEFLGGAVEEAAHGS